MGIQVLFFDALNVLVVSGIIYFIIIIIITQFLETALYLSCLSMYIFSKL